METMKYKIYITAIVLILGTSLYGQKVSRTLEVYSITEYIDGFVIKAIDTVRFDTLNIITIKSKKPVSKVKKIRVGQVYSFTYEDLISKLLTVSTNSHVAKIKSTIVWRKEDGYNNLPVYSTNIRGLWLISD